MCISRSLVWRFTLLWVLYHTLISGYSDQQGYWHSSGCALIFILLINELFIWCFYLFIQHFKNASNLMAYLQVERFLDLKEFSLFRHISCYWQSYTIVTMCWINKVSCYFILFPKLIRLLPGNTWSNWTGR